MKKKIVLFFCLNLAAFANSLPAQQSDTLRACIDSAIVHAQRFSINRNFVDWPSVEAEVRRRADSARTVLELRPAFRYLLEALHDSHGRFLLQKKPIAWYHGTPEPHQQAIDPKVWAVIQSGKYSFQAAMLPRTTGYLRIVSMPQGDNVALAAPIQTAVCSLLAQGARRWIIDLRYNGGGNMHAMLAGIANLLGDGEIGGSMDGDGYRYSTWVLAKGDVFYNNFCSADMENKCPLEQLPRIAVLTSRYTVSSGEVVAAAFKGRPDTRFFGEHTAGFTTETNWRTLPAGVSMSIAASYYADREGRVYKQFIPVDEEVEFVPGADVEQDAGIIRALEWLLKI